MYSLFLSGQHPLFLSLFYLLFRSQLNNDIAQLFSSSQQSKTEPDEAEEEEEDIEDDDDEGESYAEDEDEEADERYFASVPFSQDQGFGFPRDENTHGPS